MTATIQTKILHDVYKRSVQDKKQVNIQVLERDLKSKNKTMMLWLCYFLGIDGVLLLKLY